MDKLLERFLDMYRRSGHTSQACSVHCGWMQRIEQAKQEWLDAQHYYNSVQEQDLVDHAIYLLQAAEIKYMHVLKKAREAGLTYFPQISSEDEYKLE